MASSSHFQALSLEQVLEDLGSRFIVNLPPEELESIERICFQIEQAHWYYEDFVRPQAGHLPSYHLRKFSEILFRTNPLLSDHDPAQAYDHFLKYKERVPVCGAIILSANWDKCILVKGWKSGASWSFPRGKINHGEDERDCAVREVWEEIGYDISPHFNADVIPHEPDSLSCPPPLPPANYPEDDCIEIMMKEQRIRLYVVSGVSEETEFQTKTRKEISAIAWAPLADLPTWSRKNKASKKDLKCYMVTPFVAPLRAWVAEHKPNSKSKKRKQGKSASTVPLNDFDIAKEFYEALAEPEEEYQEEQPDQQEDLASRSQALQALFFGTDSSPTPASKPFEPSTTAAVKSPRIGSTASFTSPAAHEEPSQYIGSSIAQHFPCIRTATSPPTSANGTSRKPQPTSDKESLLRILHKSALDASFQQQQPASKSRGTGSSNTNTPTAALTSTAAPSTIRGLTPGNHVFSNLATPSFSDYRESALSPSQFMASGATGSRDIPGSAFTETEREDARGAILLQLASQLGTGPTPPSPESSDQGYSDDEENRDDASPLNDLLAIFKEQMAADGGGRQLGEMKLTHGVLKRLEDEQTRRRVEEEDRANRALEEAMLRSQMQQQAHGQLKRSQKEVSAGEYQTNMFNGVHHKHVQSREQILQILQPSPQSPPQAQPTAQPLQLQASNDGREQHKSQLLGLFAGASPNQQKREAPHQPNMLGAVQTGSPMNTFSNNVHTSPIPPQQKQGHAAGLLSLFNAAGPGPRSFAPSTSSPAAAQHPPEFANGDRLRQLNSLVAQDAYSYHHPPPSIPNAAGANGDLARLFANASIQQQKAQ